MISQTEKGLKEPTVRIVAKLADALGVSLQSLCTGETQRFASKEVFDDKLIYEIGMTVSPMTVREKEQVLAFAKFLRKKK